MNKLQNLVRIGLIGLVGASTGACMSEEAEPSQTGPITTLNLDSGAEINFYEPTSGELVVVMKGDLPSDVDGLNPLAIYEALAGTAAPDVLREAQARADRALAARPPRGPATQDLVSDPQSGGSSLTAADFSSSYCNASPVDFDYCWTNRTNNYEIDITSVDWIHVHANAYSGQFVLSLSRKQLIGWDLIQSDTVVGATTVVTQSTTVDDTYRIEVLQAAGDGYHLSIHGQK